MYDNTMASAFCSLEGLSVLKVSVMWRSERSSGGCNNSHKIVHSVSVDMSEVKPAWRHCLFSSNRKCGPLQQPNTKCTSLAATQWQAFLRLALCWTWSHVKVHGDTSHNFLTWLHVTMQQGPTTRRTLIYSAVMLVMVLQLVGRRRAHNLGCCYHTSRLEVMKTMA